jgi:GGDEF domain-containing protein
VTGRRICRGSSRLERTITCTSHTRLRCSISGCRSQAQQIKNINARKQLEASYARSASNWLFLACHDPLTRLGNRAALATDLETAIAAAREGKPSALVYVDLDNFKVVNDTVRPRGRRSAPGAPRFSAEECDPQQ